MWLGSQIYALYQPIFALPSNRYYIYLMGSGLLLSNFFEAWMLMVVNAWFASLLGIFALPSLSYTIFFQQLMQFLAAVLVLQINGNLRLILSNRLINFLHQQLSRHFVANWLRNYHFYLFTFHPNQQATINLAQNFFTHSHDLGYLSLQVISNWLKLSINFMLGAYVLWYFSLPLSITVGHWTLVMPSFMLISTMIYAIAHNQGVRYLTKNWLYLEQQKNQVKQALFGQVMHIEHYAENIAVLNGAAKEQAYLSQLLDGFINLKKQLTLQGVKLQSLELFKVQFTQVMALLLAVPSLMAQTIAPYEILRIAGAMQQIIDFFSLSHWHNEEYHEVNTTVHQLQALVEKLKDCEQLTQQRISELNLQSSNAFTLHNLRVNKPNGQPLLNQVNLALSPGKIGLLAGASGSGKTTLLRTLAGLWPFAKGHIELPVSNTLGDVFFLAQEPYLPLNHSLLGVITYPQPVPTEVGKLNQIQAWLKTLNLAELIPNLQQIKPWQNSLSRGERQRIALIAALYYQPKCLFMDEALSALDPYTQAQAQQLIKQVLPNVTLLSVEHQIPATTTSLLGPVLPFHDYQLTLDPHTQSVAATASHAHLASAPWLIHK